jgi:nitrate reductase (NAD(P)H)
MMPEYHIGTLDEAARKILAEGEVHAAADSEPQPIFLDSRIWKKTVLTEKLPVSWDSRIFTFQLEHKDQDLGLPTGQHLMMRLRDPVTREAIIRSYTPISEVSEKGEVRILIKIYNDTAEKQGGKMTRALDALPIGHGIDFKGPIGKFEYLGKGRCSINGVERTVKRFFMICGGSGVTPIFQVFRAVMQDKGDLTVCTVLNGNRLEEDILCREDLDRFAGGNEDRCKLLYTLTKGTPEWKGLRGRIGQELLDEHVAKQEDSMVLICGPEALEKSAHVLLNQQGWEDKDLLFF